MPAAPDAGAAPLGASDAAPDGAPARDVKKALLVILDGFGIREANEWNAIEQAKTPTLDRLRAEFPSTYLETSGLSVGLPEGQMGNSEVGHMNIGAGRVIHQMLTRIDLAVRDGSFMENEVLVEAVEHAKRNDSSLHLMGLLSDGGVHSLQRHLHALLDLAATRGLASERVFVHAFTDGRDTSPTGGAKYVADLEGHMVHAGGGVVDYTGGAGAPTGDAVHPFGRIATVSGRYHAMDRDKRWDRTKKAWDAIVHANAPKATTASGFLRQSYEAGVTDEFLEPHVVLGEYEGVNDGDSVFFFNFRPDRARQLTRAFTGKDFADFATGDRPRVHYATMTKYDDTFNVPFAFKDERPETPIGKVLADAGLKQLRAAETEKYPHVTFFFNGGEERQFPGEDRVLVQSPKDVPTYDHAPDMSAPGVTDAVVDALNAETYAFVVMNYANCDMVGHTGDFDATVRAVETVDGCLARVLEAAHAHGYHVFLTADHGNAEEMKNPDGSPQTAHTTLPVPFVYAPPPGAPAVRVEPGILADVAPTILHVMGLGKPDGMTGKVLVHDG